MADRPINEKLWAMVISQARLKYHPYPSPGASAWVHKRYEELGGKFEKTSGDTKRKKELKKQWENRLREKHAHGDHDPRASKKEDKKDSK